jgi:hypothetical protein
VVVVWWRTDQWKKNRTCLQVNDNLNHISKLYIVHHATRGNQTHNLPFDLSFFCVAQTYTRRVCCNCSQIYAKLDVTFVFFIHLHYFEICTPITLMITKIYSDLYIFQFYFQQTYQSFIQDTSHTSTTRIYRYIGK